MADQVTQWGLEVQPDSVLLEYPRPQLVRSLPWYNLNGLWEWEVSMRCA